MDRLQQSKLGVALFLAGLAACSTTAQEQAPQARESAELRSYSVKGRPIEFFVHGAGDRTILVIATIHGNESAGTPLLKALLTRLENNPSWLVDTRVIVVPVANPDGLASGTRHNANGVDLNRNFPADNRTERARHGKAALSEPETRFLVNLVKEFQPTRILSFHQPVGVIDWDGPAEEVARAMAAASPFQAHRLGSRPGSFGSWAGVDLNIPIVTIELPRSADRFTANQAWEKYGALLRIGLR